MSNFSKRLVDLIKDKNIEQKQMCKDLHIYPQQFSRWKLGQTEPNLNQLILLASYFNVSVDYLIGYENEDGTKPSFGEIINNF